MIEPEELVAKTGLTRPHTVHCMPGDNVVISMLGDADGNGACGFAVLDAKTFEVKGRWENGGATPVAQLRLLVPAAQERARLLRVRRAERLREGLRPRRRRGRAATAAGCTSGTSSERTLEQTIDLGETGLVPLEIRWLHDPDADEGFVGAALSSTMWRFQRDNGSWAADPVIAVESVELEGWPFPVPGLITDLVLSMDDRFLYFSNWLHGDLRQYDVSDPANPKLTGQLWLGGVLGKPSDAGRELNGGPQMLQLSLDGRRLYVTQLALLDLGQPVLPRAALLAAARRLRPERRHGGRPGLLRRLARPARRPRARARGAPPGRRLHDGDLPVILAHHMGEARPARLPGAAGGTAVATRRPGRRPRLNAWSPRCAMAASRRSRRALGRGGGAPRRGRAPARRGRLRGHHDRRAGRGGRASTTASSTTTSARWRTCSCGCSSGSPSG